MAVSGTQDSRPCDFSTTVRTTLNSQLSIINAHMMRKLLLSMFTRVTQHMALCPNSLALAPHHSLDPLMAAQEVARPSMASVVVTHHLHTKTSVAALAMADECADDSLLALHDSVKRKHVHWTHSRTNDVRHRQPSSLSRQAFWHHIEQCYREAYPLAGSPTGSILMFGSVVKEHHAKAWGVYTATSTTIAQCIAVSSTIGPKLHAYPGSLMACT